MLKARRYTLFRYFAVACTVLALLHSCQNEKSESDRLTLEASRRLDSLKQLRADSLHRADSILSARRKAALTRFDTIGYTNVCLRNSRQLDSIKRLFSSTRSPDSMKVLELLNRKELRFIRFGDTLVVPDRVYKDARAYSVFPQFYEAAASIPKIIFISNVYQAYACYEYGDLVRFAACNTGSKGKPTFPGRYGVVWRQEKRISSLNDEWILPYTVNFHQYAGNAFHQFEMPGRPVSHSCIRQLMPDAKWLFRWVKVAKLDSRRQFIPLSGTPVIILGMFNYARRSGGPWLELMSNYDHTIQLPAKPMDVEEALIPMSQIPKDVRGGVPNRKRYLWAEDSLIARGIIDKSFHLRESIDYNKLRAEKLALKKRAEEKRKAAEEQKNKDTQKESNG